MLRGASTTLLLLALCVAVFSCGDDSGGSDPVDAGDAGGGQGGGMDASVDMDGAVDPQPTECGEDTDCDDGDFCNGVELCMPGETDDPSGCIDGAAPCQDGELCDEAADSCEPACEVEQDADGDGHQAIVCGGDDCDDADPNRFPGNPEVCDAEGHDEDCDSSTFGDRDTDTDGFIDQRCCNTDDDGNDICGDDCDDFNRTRNPGETEVCDELDNNCDGVVDEGVKDSGFADMDGDLHGDPGAPIAEACAGRAGFSLLDDDCDDTDPTVHGAQAEICDGVDNDCDLIVDEDAMPATWYPDTDGDGFGDPAGVTMDSCSPPAGHSLLGTDCDDTDAAINPAAAEICDTVDNNCDDRIDDGVTSDGYNDADQDGYGDDGYPRQGCEGVAGFSLVGGDCHDLRPDVNPIRVEVCDMLDNDCDDDVDETVRIDGFADEDRDLYGDSDRPITGCDNFPGLAIEGGDCDDTNPAVHPSQPELCDNIDNDCDITVDEESQPVTWYIDADGDGFGAPDGDTEVSCYAVPGYSLLPLDCDDGRPSIHPAAAERCDGLDNDCNGAADFLIGPGDSEDDDGDAYADLACPGGGGSDCDDRQGASYPGAPEICDGQDNDCNGQVDENIESLSWLPDADGDGYGDSAGTPVDSCLPVAGHAPRGGDCDDANPDRRPGIPDICDDIDVDCDGVVDEDAQRFAYYLDADGDGFNGGAAIIACVAPPGGGLVSADCDDAQPAIFPGAAEVCDDVDNDCDATTDEGVSISGWVDEDGDLHGDPNRPVVVCAGIGGVSPVDDDCDDTDPSRHGGQSEVCDNVDNDCDALVDEGVLELATWYNDNDADGFGDPSDPAPFQSCDQQPLHSIRLGDCDDGDPDIHEGAAEVCDNLDNDCDGSADEGLLDLVPEACDGVDDDDCDGQVDEGCECVVGNLETCGIQTGECELGVRACEDPGVWSACLGGVTPQPELCDGLDNDCDGIDDLAEGCTCLNTDPPRPCGQQVGIGECRAGLQACIGGDWGACVGAIVPQVEACDLLDNNCDGEVDEGDTCRIFRVGGSVTGLTGELELSLGAERLTIDQDGGFVFDRLHFDGDPYEVTVTGQPADQVCAIDNGAGIVPMGDVGDVLVTCATVYRVGGDVSGIAGGQVQLALSAEGGNVRGALYLNQDGSFQFGNTIADGQDYEVTVSLPPPGQACAVVNGIGMIAGAQVNDVVVTCVDAPYAIGGTLTGAAGPVTLGLSLMGYGTYSAQLDADGSYAFATAVPDGTAYMVMVLDAPPSQQCSVANAMGTVAGADVSNVDVTCIDLQPIGGTASGLSGAVGLSLNGGPTLQVTQDGAFQFAQYLLQGAGYTVTIVAEPLGQTCMLANDTGTVGGVPVTDILLDCMDHPYSVGGDVTGLAGTARLQLNGGPELVVTGGGFTFPENVPDLYNYDVTLVSQPAGHVCTVVGGSGMVDAADITDVRLDCHPEMTYSIGGTVGGLAGGTLVLDLLVPGGLWKEVIDVTGPFVFDTWLSTGIAYSVVVSAEPDGQTCTVASGSGTIAGADVNDIVVTCVDTPFHVGGTVSGLVGDMEVSVNGGAPMLVFADGAFQFPDKFGDGAGYVVAIERQPAAASCTLTNASGNIAGVDVSDVVIDCDGNPTIVDSFIKRGAVSGPIDMVSITASEPLDPATVANVVQVTWAGPDGAFGNMDDVLLSPSMTALTGGGITVELSFAGLLSPGVYYVDVGPGITDLAGSPLAPDAWYFTLFGSEDIDFDGVPDAAEPALGLVVGEWDTDMDGISDGMEDFDGEGLVNSAEFLFGTDPANPDTDGDGITDDIEDEDWDGLGNAEEFAWGTDAAVADTDADGWYDSLEVGRGGDPLRSDSGPVLYMTGYPPIQATVVNTTDAMEANTVVAYPPVAATIVDVTGASGQSNTVVARPPIQVTVVDVTGDPNGEPNITIANPPIQVTVVDVAGVAGGSNIAVAYPPIQVTVVDVAAVGGGSIAIANPPVQTTVIEMNVGQGGQGNITMGKPPVEVDFQ